MLNNFTFLIIIKKVKFFNTQTEFKTVIIHHIYIYEFKPDERKYVLLYLIAYSKHLCKKKLFFILTVPIRRRMTIGNMFFWFVHFSIMLPMYLCLKIWFQTHRIPIKQVPINIINCFLMLNPIICKYFWFQIIYSDKKWIWKQFHRFNIYVSEKYIWHIMDKSIKPCVSKQIRLHTLMYFMYWCTW